MVRKKSRRRSRQEEDPMAGTTNLVDAMLVLALGFLIFAVIGHVSRGKTGNNGVNKGHHKCNTR